MFFLKLLDQGQRSLPRMMRGSTERLNAADWMIAVGLAACLIMGSPGGRTAEGQDNSTDEMRANFEKLESGIQIVLKYSPQDEDQAIVLADQQKKQLAELDEEYQRMIDQIQSLGNSPDQREAKMALFTSKMMSLNKALHEDVLLPHQSAVVESLVFSKILQHHGGSLLKAIETYYRKQFGLTSRQKDDLKDIEENVAEKVAEAKKRYEKELEKIKQEARTEVNKVLTPKQRELLEKLDGN